MPSRRTVLAAATSVPLTGAGCLDQLTGPSFQEATHLTTRSPIFTNDPTDWRGKPFRAEVFATPDELTAILDEEILSQHGYDHYTEFDPDQEFAAIFASKLKVIPDGVYKGWCPRNEVDGDRFIFHLPLAEWPPVLEDPDEDWVRLNRWRRNGSNPPTRTVIKVEMVDETDGKIKTCSD
ncbi:hypothetical protein [Salinilacihabitans rarus]|uniref:hypothetical protein n=1 Tax=Salinilacihabitans rarus TaxID=2961596 RepID=UPI0020C8AD3B|nr:hypothetical protein [Salinilacihabitans rarus]